jgi:putative hydrolases of HD superfamily
MEHSNGHISNGTPPGRDEAMARYIFELGHLKATPRTGWTLAGISNPESVADHSFRTALIGVLLAHEEGADPARTALICLFHDTTETRLGDIPSVGKKYLRESPEEVVADQTRELPIGLAEMISRLVSDYSSVSGFEAQLAKDADKLECLAQAVEYVESGSVQANAWIGALEKEICSESGLRLATAIQETPPSQWWKHFVENYRGAPIS